MDFSIENLAVVKLFGVEIWITETYVSTWIIMAVLIGLAIVVRVQLKKFTDVPKGFQNAVETAVEFFDNFVRSSAGERLMFLGNWFFMVFAFLLFSNLSGLVGLRPPTADWSTAFAFAITTFFLIQVMGAIYNGKAYAKGFIEPFFLFLPLNIIGELARPISLSFRLFGNILGGMILISLLYGLAPIFVRFVVPAALHAYFDIFSGVLQTYIFCVLSLSFIGVMAGTAEGASS